MRGITKPTPPRDVYPETPTASVPPAHSYRAALIGCGRMGAFIDNEGTSPRAFSHAAGYLACARTELRTQRRSKMRMLRRLAGRFRRHPEGPGRTGYLHTPAATLAYGVRKRVELARAIQRDVLDCARHPERHPARRRQAG